MDDMFGLTHIQIKRHMNCLTLQTVKKKKQTKKTLQTVLSHRMHSYEHCLICEYLWNHKLGHGRKTLLHTIEKKEYVLHYVRIYLKDTERENWTIFYSYLNASMDQIIPTV